MTRRWLASHSVTRTAERTAWVLVVGGMLLLVAPVRVPVPDASTQSAVPGAVAMPVRGVPGASWLDANPFAVSRRAPARRWLASDTSSATPEGGIATAVPAVPAVPRLFGTMVGAVGSSALLRLDAAQTAARLYMVGERGGAYTVRRILDDRVILDGPSGRIELRLRRGEARP